MSELYDEIMEYMNNDVSSIYKDLEDINQEISDLQGFYDNMMEYNSDYEYDLEILKKVCDEKLFEKFKEGIFILDRIDVKKLMNEVQVKEIRNLIDDISKKLFELINSKVKDYEKLKKAYSKKKEAYQLVIDSLNDLSTENEKKLKSLKLDSKLNELINNYLLNIKKTGHTILKINHDSIDLIKKYIRKFYNLSIQEKNSIISANELILQNDYDNLLNVAFGFNIDEILFYTTIYNLIDEFNEYIDLQDEKNIDELKVYLEENIKRINSLLHKLSNIEKIMEEKEESETIENDNEKNNIVIFLDIDESDKTGNKETISVANSDIQFIKNSFGGEAENDIKKLIRMLNMRFIGMNSNLFKKLGRDANKAIVNHSSKIFDELNVWCSKGMVNNPSRVPYFIVSVSENNKKELIERYHLDKDSCVYLILGLFTKKNDDSEYVRITGNRLNREYEKIMFIKKLFSDDFDELSRKTVFKMIDKSREIMDNLNEVYQEEKVK